MSVIHASDPLKDDLARLGVDLPELVAENRDVLTNWRGHHPPDGYVCSLPCTVKEPVLRAAVIHVLEQIGRTHFDDSQRLEECVLGVVPFDEDTAPTWTLLQEPHDLGRWCPLDMFDPASSGWIYLNDCMEMDFDLACVIFAHECGHAACRRRDWVDPDDAGVSVRWLAEARANQYVIEWGFGRELWEARASGTDFVITYEDVREARRQAERGLTPALARCPGGDEEHVDVVGVIGA